MPPELKIVKSLEWCTELPLKDCLRKSSVFSINGNEFSFTFVLRMVSNEWDYSLYLESVSEEVAFKPFTVRLEAGFKKQVTLSLPGKTFTLLNGKKQEIWYLSMKNLQSLLPSDFMDGNWIKFLLHFDNVDESRLKIHKEVGK